MKCFGTDGNVELSFLCVVLFLLSSLNTLLVVGFYTYICQGLQIGIYTCKTLDRPLLGSLHICYCNISIRFSESLCFKQVLSRICLDSLTVIAHNNGSEVPDIGPCIFAVLFLILTTILKARCYDFHFRMRKLNMRSTLTNIKDMPGGKRSVDTGLGLCNDKSLLLYLHHNSSLNINERS